MTSLTAWVDMQSQEVLPQYSGYSNTKAVSTQQQAWEIKKTQLHDYV
jgi:hypothetical protein